MPYRSLRPYQMDAFKYSLQVDNPALLMEMRLGKTLPTVRRCQLYKPQHADLLGLVIAPNSALHSWEKELIKEGHEFTRMDGTTIEKGDQLRDISRGNQQSSWYLLNKEAHLHVPQFSDIQWDFLVLDESPVIKNPSAKISKFFIKKLRHVLHKWVLTGTIAPESILDVFCQMVFLLGSFLGYDNFWQFRIKYFKPDYMGYKWLPKPGTLDLIWGEIAKHCFILRRKDLGLDPEITRVVRKIKFPDSIQKTYQEIEDSYCLEYKGEILDDTKWVLEKYNWMRLLCGGILQHELIWHGKIKELLHLLTTELSEEPVVVWFNFNEELKMVSQALKKRKIKHGILWGDIKPTERDKITDKFQGGKFRVLLVQQAVAQMGQDFSRADTAIFYSEPMGMLANTQTRDRILQIGDKSLLLVYLVVEDTIDEDIRSVMGAKHYKLDFGLNKAIQYQMRKRRSK